MTRWGLRSARLNSLSRPTRKWSYLGYCWGYYLLWNARLELWGLFWCTSNFRFHLLHVFTLLACSLEPLLLHDQNASQQFERFEVLDVRDSKLRWFPVKIRIGQPRRSHKIICIHLRSIRHTRWARADRIWNSSWFVNVRFSKFQLYMMVNKIRKNTPKHI